MKKFSLKVLIILSLGHLVVDIYQGGLPAILPFLKDSLGLTYTMTGSILMMSNLTSSLLQPIFGFYSDKKEKAALLPMGLLCAGVGFSLLFIPASFTAIIILVVISGLGVASYHPEGYKTAHFFTGQKSATGMSIFSVGGNLGFSLGPVFAIYIIHYLGFSWFPIVILPALLCMLTVLYYKKTIAVPRLEHAERQAKMPGTTLATYISLSMILAIVVTRSWMQLGLLSYIPFYYIDYLKGDPLFAGNLVFVFLFCGAAGTLIGAPIADRWGYKAFLRVSTLLSTLNFPLFFLPSIQKSYLLFIVIGIQGLVLVSTFSVTIVMAQKLMPNRLGVASGLMTGLAIGTGGLGVTLLGVVADHFGVPVALESIMLLPFIGFIMSLLLRYKEG